MDYQSDIEINENDLQKEWIAQPSLYMKYSELLVDAQENERNAKENIDVVKAQVDLKIRESEPEDHGLKKFTDPTLKSLVDTHEKVKASKKEYNKKRKEAALMQAVVNAMDHRKKALEYLSRFHLSGFNCYPKLDEMDEKIFKDNVRKKVNKRRKELKWE